MIYFVVLQVKYNLATRLSCKILKKPFVFTGAVIKTRTLYATSSLKHKYECQICLKSNHSSRMHSIKEFWFNLTRQHKALYKTFNTPIRICFACCITLYFLVCSSSLFYEVIELTKRRLERSRWKSVLWHLPV